LDFLLWDLNAAMSPERIAARICAIRTLIPKDGS
jgi:hypothetical protein